MAFRKKAEMILAYQPDIVVVPECEHPDKLKFKPGIPTPKDIVWFGSNTNKGLGVLSYTDLRFKALDIHNEKLQLIVPIEVRRRKTSFLLFAISSLGICPPRHALVTMRPSECFSRML